MHVYNSTSLAQREQVFHKSKEEILQIAVEGAKLVKKLAAEYSATSCLLILIYLCLADTIYLCGSFGDLVTELLYCSNIGFYLAYCGCNFLVDSRN